MTRSRQTDQADGGSAVRVGALGRLLLTRGLPGSVAVVAALTVPEFSVGAGDLGGAKGREKPLDPSASARQALGKLISNAAKAPLAGVRYGALFDISSAATTSATPARIADVTPPAINADGAVPALAAISAIEPRVSTRPSLERAETRRAAAAARSALDQAATYAATVIEAQDLVPGRRVEAALAAAAKPPAPAASKPSLTTAAIYAAAALEKFAEPAALRPEVTFEHEGDAVADFERALSEVVDAPLILAAPVPEALVAAPGLADEGMRETALASPPPAPQTIVDQAPLAAPLTTALPQPAPAGLGKPVALAAAPALAPLPAAAASAASRPATPTVALAPLPKPVFAAPPPGIGKSGPQAFEIQSQLMTRVDGKAVGTVDFQQTTTGLAVRLGSIVDLLADRYDPGEIARIKASAASSLYVPLADLQAQGIPISYDPVYDEFNVGKTDTRPTAARKVHMDQISTPERGLNTAAMDQIWR